MKIKRILITGDDGYNSIGTRLLVHFLKSKFELYVVGTKDQQSGVGGQVNVNTGGVWGRATVEGVPAFWVDGSPVDAMECLRSSCNKLFDLILSGINLGVNIGGSIISSGTVAAAYRALSLGLAPRAIAISWDVHYRHFFRQNKDGDNLEEYLKYPGEVTYHLIQKSLKNNLWGASLLNINLPTNETHQVRATKLSLDNYGYWPPAVVDEKTNRFYYPSGNQNNKIQSLDLDSQAVADGYISVSPLSPEMLDKKAYQKAKSQIIKLD